MLKFFTRLGYRKEAPSSEEVVQGPLQQKIDEMVIRHHAVMVVELAMDQEDKGEWVRNMGRAVCGNSSPREILEGNSPLSEDDLRDFEVSTAMYLFGNGYRLSEIVGFYSPRHSEGGVKIAQYFKDLGFHDFPVFDVDQTQTFLEQVGKRILEVSAE